MSARHPSAALAAAAALCSAVVLLYAAVHSPVPFCPPPPGWRPAACPPAASPASAPVASPDAREEWHAVYLGGKRMGHIHATRRFFPGRPGVWREETDWRLTFSRMGIGIGIRIRTQIDEDEKGAILSFSMTTRASTVDMSVIGVVENDRLHLFVGQDGREEVRPWPKGLLGPVAIERAMPVKSYAKGKKWSFRTWSLDMLRLTRVDATCEGREDVEVEGWPRRRLWKLRVRQDVMPGVVTTFWLDDKGELIKSRVPMMGTDVVTVRCIRAEALRPAESAELFLSRATIRLDRKVADPDKVTEAVFQLDLKTPASREVPLEDDRQTIVRRKGNVVDLRVRVVGPPAKRPKKVPPGFEEFLKPSAYLQSDDPDIRNAAQRAVGKETDPWRKAQRLEKWVHTAILFKDLSVGFASARETLRKGRGDCSEHAVLLAALLRAEGVPSRVACGLVYFNLPKDGAPMLGGHAWAEAWVGRWVPLDATHPRDFVSAMRIKFDASDLNAPSAGAGFLNIIHMLGQVPIKLLEVKRGPVTTSTKR